jgi:predicted  nucleic acid-binding Zn-ribbon protein
LPALLLTRNLQNNKWTNRSLAQTSISRKQFNRTIWTGNAIYTVNAKRDYGMIAVMKLGNTLLENASDEDRAEIQQKLNSVYGKYQETVNYSQGHYKLDSDPVDAVQSVVKIAGDVFGKDPRVKIGSGVVQDMLKWGVKFYEHYRRPKEQVKAQGELASQSMELQAEAAQVFEKCWDLAHADPRNAKVIDSLVAGEFGGSVLQDGQTILKNNAGFLDSKVVESMVAGINPDGSIRLKEDDFAQFAQGKMDDLQQSLADARNEVEQSQKTLDEINERARAQALAQELRAHAEAEEQKFQLTTKSARSSIYILSTFIGFSNPERARQLSIVGSATLQVVESVHQFNRAIEGASRLGTAMSSAILTGNILGAAMDIASLFGGGPSADQMILREIEQLRQQIADLNKQMNSRFDHVDTALNEIYASLNDNFLAIEAELREARVDLSTVQQNILQLHERVNSLEFNVYDYLNAGFNRQFTGYEEACFEDQNHYQLGAISQALLTQCLSQFRIYGSEFASDPLSSRKANPILSKNLWSPKGIPPHLLRDELQYGLESNLNLFSSLASAPALKLGNGALAALGTIPNPVEWARGVHAYIKLLTSKWDRLGRIYPLETTQKLIERGKVLQQFSAAIGTETGFNGIRANEAFFLKLLNNYREKSNALGQIIDEKMNARYSKRATGHFPMTDDPEKSDGGFAPLERAPNNPAYTSNPDLYGTKLFPEFFSSVPKVYKFTHQIGIGDLVIMLSPLMLEVKEKPASYTYETCEASNKCRAGLDVLIGYVSSDRSKLAVLSWKVYEFKDQPPYFVGKYSGIGGSKLDLGEYIKKRVESYSSFDEFKSDVTVKDRMVNFVETPYWYNGNNIAKQQELLPKLKEAQLQAQQKYADDLRSFATNDDMLTAATDLGVAKQLLESYLQLGLPQTFASSDELRGYFGGNQSLIDDKILLEAFQRSQPGTISKLALRFEEESNKRIDRFEKVLKDTLKDVHEPESLPVVKNTMKELELILNAQKAAKPSSYSVEQAYQRASAELETLIQ